MSPKRELTPEEIRLNGLALEVPIDEITIGDRVRKDFAHVPELANSIREDGLIQPIVLDYNKRLIAGESRIRAHRLLGLKTIRAVFRGVLDEAQLVVLEATENNARKDLTWQERVLSVDKVHRIRSTNAALAGEVWGVRETGKLLGQGKSNISLATTLAEYIHANDPEIVAASGPREAYAILMARQAKEADRLIAAMTIPAGKPTTKYTGPAVETKPLPVPDDAFFATLEGDGPLRVTTPFQPGVQAPSADNEDPGAPGQVVGGTGTVVPLSQMLFNANAVDFCRDLSPDSFDHIITDWPYGIDMDMLNDNNQHGGMKNIDVTRDQHDVKENEELHSVIMPELYRILKPGGYFITWTDFMQWQRNYDLAISAGFRVQRWPLVWHKTSACMNQAANTNFTKNYEIAIVCRKGNSALSRPQPSSIWTGGNDTETKALGHPFAKPFGLWNWLFEAVTRKGQSVLDPFAGVGSSTVAAVRYGLRPVACELVKDHHDKLVVNVSNVYKSLDPSVKFS